ncbi:DUF1796 family putative cysteine peptidase [Campylobacter sp. W0066.1]|uniref:DUF1796 family putative cysteine peptidase n=1 Tax=Campylobacter sp. W0066.1 TaxID=2735751 RepID=UPI0029831010|nr:papain-like cysteine peptidase [Campylobacter sp. W0066.1]HEG2607317.1 hypothetical protein [Campylobacter lari]
MNFQTKKNSLEKIHADIVLSIGVNCRVAYYLESYNLRKMANPIDWMMEFDLEAVYELFKTDFKNFFINFSKEGVFNQQYLKIKDLKTNMVSIHHFNHSDKLEKQVQEFNSQSIRRWLKLKNKIVNSKNIVFVYNGTDEDNITSFLTLIATYFGIEKNYFFIQVKNNQNKKWNEIEINQYEITKNIKYYQYIGNDINITNNSENFWQGNQFLWGEVMKNISLLENEFFKEIVKLKGAVQIVKNHLCYKFGETTIYHSKDFFSYLKIPFMLYCISLAHKEKIKNKDRNLSLPLSVYSDYQEALEIKRSFIYKLGQTLIGSSNDNFINKNIIIWREIYKLRKNLKKQLIKNDKINHQKEI